MRHHSHLVRLAVFALVFSLLLSAAVAETIPYTRGLRPTAIEMGFDLEAIYEGLPHYPLTWEDDTLIIEDDGQYKNVFVSLKDWSTLKSECIDKQWRFNVKPEDIDKISIFPHEGNAIVCYANGFMLSSKFDRSYDIDGMRVYIEGGRTGYDSARWTFYMPDDSDALYDMVRFAPDGAMDLYTYTAPEPLDVNGELYEVHMEYVTYTLNLGIVEANGEYLFEATQEDTCNLTRMWLCKPGEDSAYSYDGTSWYDGNAPAPLESLDEDGLMQFYPPLPLNGKE